ncbi:MAG: hypothetical protein ACK5P6_12525 [Pseudobdellovibrionaceae bacterium]
MLPYEFYKVMHILGIMLLFLGLGGILFSFALTSNVKGKVKFFGFLTHGLGLLLVLTGGFGMAARLGLVQGLPNWIYAKLIVWGLLGLSISIAKRKASHMLLAISSLILLGFAGTYLAVYKPF